MWLYAKIIEVKNYTDTKYLIIFGKRLNWDPLGYTVIFQKINEFKIQVALADPRGAPGTRAPPGGPNSFIFMQFSAKN